MGKWTKTDAASEQLDAAIAMLADRKFVAAHTLAAVAGELATDCARSAGRRTNAMVLDELFVRAVPENIREVRAAFRQPQNFAKHADRDPHAEIDVKPEFTMALLFQAVIDLGVAFERQTFRQLIFRTWFLARFWERWDETYRSQLLQAQSVFPGLHALELADAIDELRLKIAELDTPDLRDSFAERLVEMDVQWTDQVWNPS